MSTQGKVTVEYPDGKGFTAPLSECIVIKPAVGRPRELEAMAQCHDWLRNLRPAEANRVAVWLVSMFPDVQTAEKE